MANAKHIIIDGVEYNVPLLELERKGDVLDLTANRTEDGVLHREIIGTFYNYTIKIGQCRDRELYETLWNVLTAPTNHRVELPHDHIEFEGYFGSCKDNIFLIDEENGNRVRGFSCNLVAVRPARTPATEGVPSTQ